MFTLYLYAAPVAALCSLSKRSKYGAAGETPAPVPSKITVRRRAPDDAENAARKRARATLENPELAAAAAE